MNQPTNCFLLTLSLGVFFAGCNAQRSQPGAESAPAGAETAEHDHPETGPHGGDLIELGSDQYHAEIMHGDQATVYVLDGSAQKTVAIDAAEIVINVSHDGEARQFRLSADPESADSGGKSSRFSSSDADLVATLNGGDGVEIVANIDGKQFRGRLDHHHGEDGHKH